MDNQSFCLRRLCTPDRIFSRPGVRVSALAQVPATLQRGSQRSLIGSASMPSLHSVAEGQLSASGWETRTHVASPEFRLRFAEKRRLGDIFRQTEQSKSHFSLTTATDGHGPFTSAQMHFRLPDKVFVDKFVGHTKVGIHSDRETQYRECVYKQWLATGVKEPSCFRP